MTKQEDSLCLCADRARQWRWIIDSYIKKYTILYFIVYLHEINNIQ